MGNVFQTWPSTEISNHSSSITVLLVTTLLYVLDLGFRMSVDSDTTSQNSHTITPDTITHFRHVRLYPYRPSLEICQDHTEIDRAGSTQ